MQIEQVSGSCKEDNNYPNSGQVLQERAGFIEKDNQGIEIDKIVPVSERAKSLLKNMMLSNKEAVIEKSDIKDMKDGLIPNNCQA